MTLVDAASSILESSASSSARRQDHAPSATVSIDGREIDSSHHSICSISLSSVSSPPISAHMKGGFVETLRQKLDNEEQHSQVIAWMPDGKAFTIVNHKQFVKDFMPRIFNIKNMSSFVRKLSRFGFARKFDKKSMNPDIFAHPDFVRGDPERAANIKCAPLPKASPSAVSTANKAKAAASAATPSWAQANARTCATPRRLPAKEIHQGSSRVSPREDAPRAMGGGPTTLFAPPSPTPQVQDSAHLHAAIATLMLEREALRQGADANTLALVHLLQEQQRVRSASSLQAVASSTAPSLQEQLSRPLAVPVSSPQTILLLSSYLHAATQQRYSLQHLPFAHQHS
jgi:hypothetical protein